MNVWRKKYAQGEVIVLRYADDIILGFQYQTDADRFLENLRERLGKFGLELHPEKTRRIEFGRYAEENRRRRGEGKPETFDFLGFTHISGKNRLGRYIGAAHEYPQAHASQAAASQAGAPRANARSCAPNRWMAQIGRTRLLQLLRGAGEPCESGRISGSGTCALVAHSSSPGPETPHLVDAHPRASSTLASPAANAPPVS